MAEASPVGLRLRTLDAVRGVAVMGILLLNIIDMAMPGYAYVDPHFYGGASGPNWWEWAIVHIVADGKMRGLFTMLFGASTILIAERALAGGENPARVHYARMATLLGFGVAHAYLIWSGDILTLYAVAGAIAFVAWRWRARVLVTVAIALLAFKLADGLIAYRTIDSLRVASARPGADSDTAVRWREYIDAAKPPPSAAADDLAAYRGSYGDAFRRRAPVAAMVQARIGPDVLPETLALIALGMALFRFGFFSGAWSRRAYWLAAAPVPLLWLADVPLLRWIDASGFAPWVLVATGTIELMVLRPVLCVGYAALMILFVQSGRWRAMTDRLAATGRMAFSNYLGTSIVGTLLFNGYGLGWYGHLLRWQCLIVVAAMWAWMLAWSKPWLDRFFYGPFEWVWRSAARARLQPFVRTKAANASQ